jgi:endo-1,3(4)-beta-glucanase
MTDILSNYQQVYPTGADVSYQIRNDVANITFAFKTSNQANPKLLMAVMPHQMDCLTPSNPVVLNNAYDGINGPLSLVQGNVLVLHEPLPTITWNAPTPIDASKQSAILQALNADKSMTMPASDPYFFGKQVARNGRLALIADQLNQPDIASGIRAAMKTEMNKWLNSQNSDKLVYDTTWGGICSSRGLANFGADFGNGLYNDHHFHYGYHIYAAAVIAKADPAWASAYASKVNDLVRDFANPTTADPFFPVTRHKDWYAGHSWASGITAFGDSKNQESTSESINAYYGVYLWGLATQNQAITDLGRVMLATEIRSAKKYWQMTSASSMSPTPFSNNKVVGILWSTKLDYGTWFGSNVEFIHCIQMMPFTPITENYLPASWITEEYPVVSTALTRTNPVLSQDWKGYIYMAHAIIDSQTAWNEVNSLTSYDNGNTKTNALYWVATRPNGSTNNSNNGNTNQDLC